MARGFTGFLASALLVALLFAASVSIGPAGVRPPPPIGPLDLVALLRIYRSVAAAGVGALLGLAGALIQYSVSNPLAAPSLLGLPQGALVAAAGLTLALNAPPPPGLGLLVASLGALAAYWVTMAVAYRGGLSGEGLVVAGIAVSSALTGLAGLLLMLVESRLGILGAELLLGTFAYATRSDALVAAVSAAALVAASLPLLGRLDLLSYGDEVASAAGVSPPLARLAATLLAAAATAAAIYVAGLVGFVGLIAPAAARGLVGGHPARSVPVSAVLGAAVTLGADTAARLAAPALGLGELPAGTATSLVGGLFLAYLAARGAASGAV